jgi:alanine dehydrogenase
MTLWLSNDDARELLTPQDYLEAVEAGYREMGLGRVVERQPSRTHTYVEATGKAPPGARFCCRTIEGGVPALGVYAVRLCSEVPHEILVDGMRRKDKPPAIDGRKYLGLVFLLSLEDGALLAMLQDAYLNMMCTGATGALGVKHLAREDASTIGMIGSGWQAGGQLRSICSVRPIRRVRVFSPTAANREAFADEMSKELGIAVEAVAAPTDAVRGADIVVTATNSYDPFFRGAWLEPGQHLDVMGGGDRNNRMRELDDECYRRADLVVINARDQVAYDRPEDLFDPVDRGELDWDEVAQLPDVIAGTSLGRTSPDQITLHRHNTGLGLWYASAGHRLYHEALQQGRGIEIPSDWFTQDLRT